jgi:hypothetical protein
MVYWRRVITVAYFGSSVLFLQWLKVLTSGSVRAEQRCVRRAATAGVGKSPPRVKYGPNPSPTGYLGPSQ